MESARLQDLKLYPQRPGRDLRLSQRECVAWSSGIPEDDVLTLNPAEVLEPSLECSDERLRGFARGTAQPTYARNLSRWLRVGGQRHGDKAESDAGDKRPPINHSITSSARSRMARKTMIPGSHARHQWRRSRVDSKPLRWV